MPAATAMPPPLPAAYFPRTPFPPALVASFEEAAKAQLTADLTRLHDECRQNAAPTASPSRRQVVRTDEHGYSVLERHGVSVRTRTQPLQSPTDGANHFVTFTSQADIHGLPSELMDLMYADNTLALREWGKVILSTAFVDAAVLHCVHRHVGGGGAPRTFAGVTWLALQTPLATNRSSSTLKSDFCVFQTMGTRDDTQYITWTSVDAPNCPSQEHSLGLRRSQLHLTMFFQATATGTRVSCFGSVQPHTSVSKALLERVMGSVAHGLGLLDLILEAHRLSKKPLPQRSDWVPDSDRRACHVCRTAFTLFRTRHHCRACGDIMCKRCTVVRPLLSQLVAQWSCDGTDAKQVVASGEKVCLRCIAMPRPKGKGMRPTPVTNGQPALGSIVGRDQTRPIGRSSSRLHAASTPVSGQPPSHLRSKPIDIASKTSTMFMDDPSTRMSASAREDSAMLPSSHQQTFFGSTKSLSLPTTTLYMDPNEAQQQQQSMASQLWQISCRAQATWTYAKETTSRTSTPLSTPRADDASIDASMRDSFAKVNQSLTEQAYLLEALDRASRGRFSATSSPVSNNPTDSLCGRPSGWDDSVRFEVIPDDADR